MKNQLAILLLTVLLLTFLCGCNDQNESNKNPDAECRSNIIKGTAPLVIQFYGEGSDEDGFIESYKWRFENHDGISNVLYMDSSLFLICSFSWIV